jgi:hypothetical protein
LNVVVALPTFPALPQTGFDVMDQLKLVALDRDDIEVVSAHLQDAVLKAADIHWRPAERRVVIALNRFDWEAANGGAPDFRRCRTALRFERVLACKCRNLDAHAKDQTLNLLAVFFDESDSPGGTVTLTFSGGGALRLQVECLEVELADLGPAWSTECCPEHAVDETAHDERIVDTKPSAPPQQG